MENGKVSFMFFVYIGMGLMIEAIIFIPIFEDTFMGLFMGFLIGAGIGLPMISKKKRNDS